MSRSHLRWIACVGVSAALAGCEEQSGSPPTVQRAAPSPNASSDSVRILEDINRALVEILDELPQEPGARKAEAWARVRAKGYVTTSPYGPAPDGGGDYALDLGELGSFRHDRIVGIDRAAYLGYRVIIVSFGDSWTEEISRATLEAHLANVENRATWEAWGLDHGAAGAG